MTRVKTIHIVSDDLNIELQTESDITYHTLRRLEKYLKAVVNDDLVHDVRARMTSINLAMHMLEKVITPEAKPRFQMLKAQIEDLLRLMEDLSQ